jgi:hypothetical protein
MEWLFGTFQDRLVSELCLAGAQTLEEANPVQRKGREPLPNNPPEKLTQPATKEKKASPPKLPSSPKPGPDHPWRKPWKKKRQRYDIFTGHKHSAKI